MAKDKTEVGITGQPVPKPRTPKQQHELEKKRRMQKHLGTNVGGQQYTSGAKYYVPSTGGTNPRARTFREFVEIAEAVSASDRNLAQSGVLSRHADALQKEIDDVTSGRKKTAVKSVRKIAKQNYAVREETEIDEGIGMTMANALGNPPPLSKRMKLKQALIINKIKSDAKKPRKFSGKAVSQNEEYELDEVKGFGGHIDPETGKPTGNRSNSQKAHATHWRNRQQGKDVPDPRRSKFKYGGSKGSTTGSHEGDTPEGFAKKQDPGLAMTPSARMAARARSLELKGKGKQANKIRAVANRPNMSEG
jgi:hypothetical protein